MHEEKFLAAQFESERARLAAMAYRLLGARAEAEDVVQEAWLRLARSEAGSPDNLAGWLTTVVARICLDMLRARKSRREDALDRDVEETVASPAGGTDPERDMALADSVGVALLVVLQTLSPAERVAFVLHDMFDLPFDEIAPILERSPEATRQLASRARRRIQGADPAPEADHARRRRIVDAFLAASREGDFNALLALLDPDVLFRPDAVAARLGNATELRGAEAVAATFKGRAQGARPALFNGDLGFAVIIRGELRVAALITFAGERIAGIHAIADPAHLSRLTLQLLDD